MSNMPSNDDLKRQLDGALGGDVVTAASGLVKQSDAHTPELHAEAEVTERHQFTFFQKDKNPSSDLSKAAMAQVSGAKVREFVTRVDNAVAANMNTKRHIAELMGLMSDVAQDLTPTEILPVRQTSRRSKWLFYFCLVSFGLGWFLLFPLGQDVLIQLINLLKW